MGGMAATDDLKKRYEPQVWLASSNDPQAKKSGNYCYHNCLSHYDTRVDDPVMQQELINKLGALTNVKF